MKKRARITALSLLAVTICMANADELQILVDSKPVVEIPDSPTSAVVLDALSSALPAVLQYLSEWGIERQVDSLVEEMTPRIVKESEFAGDGGILVLADIQVRPSEAGDYIQLVGNSLHYVGIGATPVDAQLAELTRDRIRNAPDPGWRVDLDRSSALWIKRGNDGKIRVWQMSKRALVQGVLTKYSERTLAGFDWEVARAEEIQRLISIGERAALDGDARRQINELGQARSAALAARDQLNKELTRELRRAALAARNGTIVRAIAGLADFGLSAAKDGLSDEDKSELDGAKSNSELLSVLSAIERDARNAGDVIAQEVRVNTTKIDNLERQRIEIITLKGIPTSNVPSGQNPQIIVP